jgi:hypothetical protein
MIDVGALRDELEKAALAVRRQYRGTGGVHPDTEAWWSRVFRAYMEACASLSSAHLHPQDTQMRRLARHVLGHELGDRGDEIGRRLAHGWEDRAARHRRVVDSGL